jgi:hypothetical protein
MPDSNLEQNEENRYLDTGILRARDIFQGTLERMGQIVEDMESLRLKLREIQPKRSGVILMEWSKCGRGCLGCPHVRWKQWTWNPRSTNHPWQAHTIRYPLKRLRKTEPFLQSFPYAKSTILRIQELDQERKRLIREIHLLRRVLGSNFQTKEEP